MFRGSSPLARGLQREALRRTFGLGIIPARAGSTPRTGAARGTRPDHPRSRGVYPPLETTSPGQQGSSPLARGLPPVGELDLLLAGIIPARAGSTGCRMTLRRALGDHPRSRGVYGYELRSVDRSVGSSPLARGLPPDLQGLRMTSRIIPARAGSTLRSWTWGGGTPDHPRSRGVYLSWGPPTPQVVGSSPLARGLRRPQRGCVLVVRIIPARAGSTAAGSSRPPCGPDHPRSRGVYSAP